MKTRSFLVIVIAAVFFSLAGCAGSDVTSSSFVREGVDFEYITKVAVLPFENNTEDILAPERVRDIVTTQILAMEMFDIVDKGIVDSAMREMGIRKETPLDIPLSRRLGQRLGVQGFISGAVNSLGDNRQGNSFNYSEASLTLKLQDSESAEVLWRDTDSLNGYSLMDRLFGLEPMDIYQVTVSLLRRMLATLPK